MLIKKHNLIGSQYKEFSQEILLVGREGGICEVAVGQHHNVYRLIDFSIWQFHKKSCLVWLQWEGVDEEEQAIGLHIKLYC